MTLKTASSFTAAILVTCMSVSLQAEIYRSVDSSGNVLFTDKKPTSGSSEVVVLEAFTIIPAPPKISAPPSQSAQPKASKSVYASVNLIKPKNGEYFHNPEALEIEAESKPPLIQGDKYQFLLDGKTVGTSAEPKLSIPWPDRGTHIVQVRVIKGKNVVIESSKHSIYIIRTIKKKTVTPPTTPKGSTP